MNILTLIQQGSYGWAALFLCLFYGAWLIDFKLSYKIVGEKMPPTIYLAIFLMVSYVAFARPFIPHLNFLIFMGVLMIILLCGLGRLNIYKAIYATVFSVFISFLGDVFLLFVTLGIFPKLFPFIFGSKWGLLILVTVETLFPIIAISINDPRFSLRLPLRKKTDPFDLFDLGVSWTLISMYYVMNYASNTAFEAFQSNPQKIGSSLGLLFMTTFGIMGGIVIIIKCMKIMHDREIKTLIEEKERVEAENTNLKEKMYTIIDLNSNLDPNIKKSIVDSLVVAAESWAENYKPKNKPPFIINQSKMAQYEIQERDSLILAHLVLNKTNQEIADELDFSLGHVANSLTDMYKKFNLKSRRQLARFALQNKIIEIP